MKGVTINRCFFCIKLDVGTVLVMPLDFFWMCHKFIVLFSLLMEGVKDSTEVYLTFCVRRNNNIKNCSSKSRFAATAQNLCNYSSVKYTNMIIYESFSLYICMRANIAAGQLWKFCAFSSMGEEPNGSELKNFTLVLMQLPSCKLLL